MALALLRRGVLRESSREIRKYACFDLSDMRRKCRIRLNEHFAPLAEEKFSPLAGTETADVKQAFVARENAGYH